MVGRRQQQTNKQTNNNKQTNKQATTTTTTTTTTTVPTKSNDCKGAITSTIKHTIKVKTSPATARLAQL